MISETCATIVCSCKDVGAALHFMHGESVRGASAGGEAADRAGRLLKTRSFKWISGEYRLRSEEDRSGAGDRRAMAQDCAR